MTFRSTSSVHSDSGGAWSQGMGKGEKRRSGGMGPREPWTTTEHDRERSVSKLPMVRWKPSSKRSSCGVSQRVKGVYPGMAVDGAQAHQSGRELPDFVIAVAAPHGLVRHHEFISPGGLPPGQQDHGFGCVAGINRPEKGHGLEEKGGGQGRGGEKDFGLLGLKPGDARGRDHGLKKRGALHQE